MDDAAARISRLRPLRDLLAGVAIAGLLIPESMGYAGIAGLPPQAGLYATLLGLAVYALAGSSRHLVVSPTSASAATLGAAIAALLGTQATNNIAMQAALAAAAVFACGALLLTAGFLRLGFLADFISKPVLRGFVFGIALGIMIKQAPRLLGIEGGSGPAITVLIQVLLTLGHTHLWSFAVGGSALALLFILQRLAPHFPGALVVLALGIAAHHVFDLGAHDVAIVGSVPAGLPGLSLHAFPWEAWTALITTAVGMALVIFAESLGAARTFAAKHGYDIDPNRELKALGLANLAAALFRGMAVGGGTSGTAAGESAGAQTQRASLCAAFVLLATLLWLTPLFHDLPEPVLAAIVIHAVWHLANVSELRRYARVKAGELPPALVALAGVPLFGVLPGLLLAMALTLVILLRDLMDSHLVELGRLPGTRDFVDLRRHPQAERIPGVLLVRLDRPLIFASANSMHCALRSVLDSAAPGSVKSFVISMELTPSIDVTSLDMLREFHSEVAHRGMHLAFARVKDEVYELFERSGFKAELGDAQIFWSVDDAACALGESSAST